VISTFMTASLHPENPLRKPQQNAEYNYRLRLAQLHLRCTQSAGWGLGIRV